MDLFSVESFLFALPTTIISVFGATKVAKIAVKSFQEKLPQWCTDLVEEARKTNPSQTVFGRDREIEILSATLSRNQGIVVLSGPAGVGKTALVEELARRVSLNAIPTLQGYRILSLNNRAILGSNSIADMLSSMAVRRIKKAITELCEELAKKNRNQTPSFLFIDEFDTILKTDPGAFDDLKELLARSGVQILGATTDHDFMKEWKKRAAGLAGLARRLELIEIEPPSHEGMIQMLQERAQILSRQYNIQIQEQALKAILFFSDREVDGAQPAKGIRRLEQIFALASNKKLTDPINLNFVISSFSSFSKSSEDALNALLEQEASLIEFRNSFEDRFFRKNESIEHPSSSEASSQEQLSSFTESLSSSTSCIPIVTASQIRAERIIRKVKEKTVVCSISSLLKACSSEREQQETLQQTTLFLAKAKKEGITIIFEDAEPLAAALFPSQVNAQAEEATNQALQTLQSGAAAPLTGIIVQGAQSIRTFMQGGKKSEEPERAKILAKQVTSPVVQVVLKEFIRQGGSCFLLLEKDSPITSRAKALASSCFSIADPSTSELIYELAELTQVSTDVASKVLSAAFVLSGSAKTPFVFDLCYQALTTHKQKKSLATALSLSFHGSVSIRQIEEALETPIPTYETLLVKKEEGNSCSLVQFSPQLFRFCLSSFSTPLQICSFSRSILLFIEKLLLQKEGTESLNFSTLSRLPTSVQSTLLQELFQEKRFKELLLQEKEIQTQAPHLLPLLRDLSEKYNVRLILLSETPKPISSSHGLGEYISKGIQFLSPMFSQEQNSSSNPQEIRENCPIFFLHELSEDQLLLYFQNSCAKGSLLAPVLLEAYRREENSRSIDELSAFAKTFHFESETSQNIAERLLLYFHDLFSLEELLYLIDPLAVSPFYRFQKQLFSRSYRFANTLLGKPIEVVGTVFSFAFNGIARWSFWSFAYRLTRKWFQ